MARVKINTGPLDPLYNMQVVLDGTAYVFDIDYNGREDRWYFDLSLADGTVIVRGVKVVPNRDLLRKVADSNSPPGVLWALVLQSDDDSAPGLGELGIGERCTMYYTEVNG